MPYQNLCKSSKISIVRNVLKEGSAGQVKLFLLKIFIPALI